MPVTVQLVTVKSIPDEHNILQTHNPGDWVEVGRHVARQWLANGTARVPDHQRAREIIGGDLDDCGILILGAGNASVIRGKYPIASQVGALSLPYKRTLIWSGMQLEPVQTAMGFTRLEKTKDGYHYEAVAMLADNKLASQTGSKADRAGTLEMIGDLRLPVYAVRAVWMRRTEATQKLVEQWARELGNGTGAAHAFLRAVYTTRPVLCTLPANWMYPWWEK